MSKFEIFTRLDREISKEYAEYGYNLKNSCYRNAVLTLIHMDSKGILVDQPAVYAEGLAVIKSLGIPIEHGWVQRMNDGVIVDPTWADAEGEVAYFPFALYSSSWVIELTDKSAVLPFSFRIERPSARLRELAWKLAYEYVKWDRISGG